MWAFMNLGLFFISSGAFFISRDAMLRFFSVLSFQIFKFVFLFIWIKRFWFMFIRLSNVILMSNKTLLCACVLSGGDKKG